MSVAAWRITRPAFEGTIKRTGFWPIEAAGIKNEAIHSILSLDHQLTLPRQRSPMPRRRSPEEQQLAIKLDALGMKPSS